MKSFFVITVLVFYSFSIHAQKLNGIVLGYKDSLPIKYVSIGILNKSIGTYSNENGRYSLNLQNYTKTKTDTLSFSCIGYKSVRFNISDYLYLHNKKNNTIYLDEKVTELEEVIIYGKKVKYDIIGNRRASKQVIIGFFGNKESGIIIRNSNKLTLKEVSVEFSMTDEEEPDSAILRFNIYSLKNGLPDKNILIEPVYFHLYKDQFKHKVTFDINDYNIQVNKDFAATFELIKQYGGRRIYFASKIRGCKGIYRYGSQGKWQEQKADGGPLSLRQSLEILVKYED